MGGRLVINRGVARGDVFLLTPVLRALRRAIPDRRIFVQTGFPEVLSGNPDIDGAARSIDASGADVVDLDLCYERRPLMHIIDAYAEACGVSVESRRPIICVDAESKAAAAAAVPADGRWAAFHAGPGPWPGRHWPDLRWRELSERLRAEAWRVALVGMDRSMSVPCDADLRGAAPVPRLAAVIARCGLYVGIDSFPMHVAAAVDVPGVAIFGATDPALRLPGDRHFIGITAPTHRVWCLGCHHRLPAPRTESGCFRGSPLCMEDISVDAVIDAIDRVLAAAPSRPGSAPA